MAQARTRCTASALNIFEQSTEREQAAAPPLTVTAKLVSSIEQVIKEEYVYVGV